MPRLDIIILPLLAGYLFLITFNLTRYYHQRIEKQRLIYNALVFAFVLATIVYLLDYFVFQSTSTFSFLGFENQSLFNYRHRIGRFIDDLIGLENVPGLKHSIFIFLSAYPLAKILNLFISGQFAFDYTIRRWGSQLDRIIYLSLTEKNKEDKLLLITLKSYKVYIGFISKLSEPIGESHITVIPNFSGYRNKDNLTLQITTNYTEVIRKYIQKGRADQIDDKLGIVIPTNEILSISRFENELFGHFGGLQPKKPMVNALFKKLVRAIK